MSTYNYIFLKPWVLDKFRTTTEFIEKWEFENIKIFYSKKTIKIFEESNKQIKQIDGSSYFKFVEQKIIDDFFIDKFKLKFIKKYKVYTIFENNSCIGKVFEFGNVKKYYHFETEEFLNFQIFKNKFPIK